MREFKREGRTIIAVHHDLNTLCEYFDHVVMVNKQLIASGKTVETFTNENIAATYGE